MSYVASLAITPRSSPPKTVYSIYVSLASFFRWASREFRPENPVKGVPRPRVPPDPPVEPFRKEEVDALIKACDFSEEAVTDGRRKFVMPRPTAKRDKAILLTLLNTGLCAGELFALRIGDVDMRPGRVQVRPAEVAFLWQAREKEGHTAASVAILNAPSP